MAIPPASRTEAVLLVRVMVPLWVSSNISNNTSWLKVNPPAADGSRCNFSTVSITPSVLAWIVKVILLPPAEDDHFVRDAAIEVGCNYCRNIVFPSQVNFYGFCSSGASRQAEGDRGAVAFLLLK